MRVFVDPLQQGSNSIISTPLAVNTIDCTNVASLAVVGNAYFDDTLTEVNIQLNVPILTQSPEFVCQAMFVSGTAAKFGTFPRCQFVDAPGQNTIINIVLGSEPTLMPTDTLDILGAGNFPQACPGSGPALPATSVPITAPTRLPAAGINGPLIFARCVGEDLVLRASGTHLSGRPGMFRWTLDPAINNASAIDLYQDTLTVHASDLQLGNSYTFRLSVTNVYGSTSPQTTHQVTVQNVPVAVELMGNTPRTIDTKKQNYFIARTRPLGGSCAGSSGGSVSYTWTSLPQLPVNINITAAALQIPPHTLRPPAPLSPYNMALTVTMAGAGFASVPLTMNFEPFRLTAELDTQSITVPVGAIPVFDASASEVPVGYPTQYNWDCRDDMNRRCLDKTYNLVALPGSASSVWTFPTANLFPGRYNLILTTRIVNTSQPITYTPATTTATVTVVPFATNTRPFILLQSDAVNGVIGQDDELTLVATYTALGVPMTSFAGWSEPSGRKYLDDPLVNPLGRLSVRLVLNKAEDENFFTPGNPYTFVAAFNTPQGVFKSAVTVFVPDPARGGTLRVAPVSGNALSTLFTLQAPGFTSFRGQVNYEFFYLSPTSNLEIQLQPPIPDIQVGARLPPGDPANANKLTIGVWMTDPLRFWSLATTTVTVAPLVGSTLNQITTAYGNERNPASAVGDALTITHLTSALGVILNRRTTEDAEKTAVKSLRAAAINEITTRRTNLSPEGTLGPLTELTSTNDELEEVSLGATITAYQLVAQTAVRAAWPPDLLASMLQSMDNVVDGLAAIYAPLLYPDIQSVGDGSMFETTGDTAEATGKSDSARTQALPSSGSKADSNDKGKDKRVGVMALSRTNADAALLALQNIHKAYATVALQEIGGEVNLTVPDPNILPSFFKSYYDIINYPNVILQLNPNISVWLQPNNFTRTSSYDYVDLGISAMDPNPFDFGYTNIASPLVTISTYGESTSTLSSLSAGILKFTLPYDPSKNTDVCQPLPTVRVLDVDPKDSDKPNLFKYRRSTRRTSSRSSYRSSGGGSYSPPAPVYRDVTKCRLTCAYFTGATWQVVTTQDIGGNNKVCYPLSAGSYAIIQEQYTVKELVPDNTGLIVGIVFGCIAGIICLAGVVITIKNKYGR